MEDVLLDKMRIRNNINPEYGLMKSLVRDDYDRVTVKLDYAQGSGYLRPQVSPNLTRFVVLHNGRLNKCSLVLAQDTVLQNYAFDTDDQEVVGVLDGFWGKYNKYQLFLAVKERYQYGWGCLEVLFDDEGKPASIVQFPAYTAVVKKRNGRYYAVQRGVNGADKELRLMQYLDTYPPEDEELPVCLWLGGDATHEFYDVPVWYSDVDSVLAKINLDMLTGEQVNNGNNMDGVLIVSGPPQRHNDDGELPEQVFQRKISETGTGTLTMYMESSMQGIPMNVDYVKIGNDNWSYLESFSKSCDNALMSNFSIPKARLMIDDTTESMNSNKTNTIWEIYTICLNYEQYSNELLIHDFNKTFFGVDVDVEMETPIFTDIEQTNLMNLTLLYNNGLITLSQALKELKMMKPKLDFTNIDLDAPDLNTRFYNGNVLGVEDMETTDGLMNWLNGLNFDNDIINTE